MKAVAFIEPPQGDVIENIFRHCGLWHPSSPRSRPPRTLGSTTRTAMRTARRPLPTREREVTYVDIDMFDTTS